MTVEEIQARHKDDDSNDFGYSYSRSDIAKIHADRGWLLSEHARLTHELAEERAACTIAGHAMDAMRTTIERKDEEIRLLRSALRLAQEYSDTEYVNGDTIAGSEEIADKVIASIDALEAFDNKNV